MGSNPGYLLTSFLLYKNKFAQPNSKFHNWVFKIVLKSMLKMRTVKLRYIMPVLLVTNQLSKLS